MGRPSSQKDKEKRIGSNCVKKYPHPLGAYQSASLPGNVTFCFNVDTNSVSKPKELAATEPPRKNILNRLPDYLRDTVDWFIGRSRRSKERTTTVNERMSKRIASASYAVRAPPKSPDLVCVCDSIDEKMVEKITSLPQGIDEREWIAHNILGLFDHVNALCGTVTEICTPITCQHMSYPGTSKASYQDDRNKRQYYPAMQYIDCVMSQCETMSRQEDIFPTKYGNVFGDNFVPSVKKMLRYMWHCMGHLYIKHWNELGILQLRPQCAMVLAHISVMGRTFNLLDPKDQHNVDATVIMVRPDVQVLSVPNSGEDGDHLTSENNRAVRVPSSKSGSWGGYPSPAILASKPYAQTC
ncbi:unnamed protein product [Caenorhabditis bovis]|uniref:Mob1/phocein family protein n=1 Tax=Caenorhabditis bovis TaxID=2654633 RepID=A0A8S1EAI6_9PELO|nr:unnamed protein product [Caenorhabditis bovis]